MSDQGANGKANGHGDRPPDAADLANELQTLRAQVFVLENNAKRRHHEQDELLAKVRDLHESRREDRGVMADTQGVVYALSAKVDAVLAILEELKPKPEAI